MKITRVVLLLSAAIFAGACSKDDDAKSSLENAKISLAANTQVIKAPAGLANSEDANAQQANAWIQMANGMSSYLTYFDLPDGAKKSTTKITASNGRTKATGDVLVYTWTDEQSGTTIAYQVSEESDKYVWEFFWKTNGEWLKYFHAEEKKDKSAGSMKIYDIFGIYGDNPSYIFVEYSWGRVGDIFTLEMSFPGDEYAVI